MHLTKLKSGVECIFLVKRHGKKTDEKVCQKSIAKKKKLWYSVCEAWCGFGRYFSQVGGPLTNRQQMHKQQSFNIWRRYIFQEEIAANMYSGSEVNSVGMLSVFPLNDYVRGNQFGKIVHSQSCKDLLENILRFFRVKIG